MGYPARRRFDPFKTKYLYQSGDFNDLIE